MGVVVSVGVFHTYVRLLANAVAYMGVRRLWPGDSRRRFPSDTSSVRTVVRRIATRSVPLAVWLTGQQSGHASY